MSKEYIKYIPAALGREKVQDKSSGCSTLLVHPFVTRCHVLVIFLVFNHRELHIKYNQLSFLLHGSLLLGAIKFRKLRGFVDTES